MKKLAARIKQICAENAICVKCQAGYGSGMAGYCAETDVKKLISVAADRFLPDLVFYLRKAAETYAAPSKFLAAKAGWPCPPLS